MLKIKNYKYRLYPTKKQILILIHTLDACRILYNSCVIERKNAFENTGKGLTTIRHQEILKSDKKITSRWHPLSSHAEYFVSR
jgi:transposase